VGEDRVRLGRTFGDDGDEPLDVTAKDGAARGRY
jgi:hypothetical protein